MLLKIFVFPWSKLVINVSGFRVFVWCKCYFYQITEWLVMKAIWGSLIVLEVSEKKRIECLFLFLNEVSMVLVT